MSAAEPILSVVVPTKGRLGYLERCLGALAKADYPRERFEVVVVNDGGGTEIERIVASARGVQPVVTTPERTGPSGARNEGARVARGEFVAFTDDDCEPDPDWLTALERALGASPGAAVGGRTLNGAPDNAGAVATQLVVDALHAHYNRDPGAPRFFASYNLAFPSQPFRTLGGFDPGFRYAEDRELCRRWLLAGHRFAYAPDALVHHMRTLTLREFLAQHYGYGRGARALRRTAPRDDPQGDSGSVVRELASRTMRHPRRRRLAVAGYVGLSQLATASGYAREATLGDSPG